ncbi:MAG: hypothetical protein V4723_04280 [Pseudomonadota bacterium]
MNRFLIFCTIALLLCTSAMAGTLSAKETDTLKTDIELMYAAFESGDARILLNKTHSSVYRLSGGKRALQESLRKAMLYLREHHVKYIQSELGSPTATYTAGSEEVCFVPRTSVLGINGKRVKTTGFLIAIRSLSGGSWKYIDSAALIENPELLRTLLPKLHIPEELPKNSTELLD